MDLFQLSGRNAIVTGASRSTGLCFAIAKALHDAGADVALFGGSAENLEKMRELLRADSRYYVVDGDLTDRDSREEGFRRIADRFDGRIDILVNGAGTQYRCPAADFPPEKWEQVLAINLSAMFYLSQMAGRVMLRQGSGKIINIASMNSFLGGNIVPAYAASKGGVVQLTKALSNEWMPKGIQVNAIAPGFMETELSHDLMISPTGQAISRRIPAGRWGKPEDLGGTAVFLASHASDYISGCVIPVDGGYLCM